MYCVCSTQLRSTCEPLHKTKHWRQPYVKQSVTIKIYGPVQWCYITYKTDKDKHNQVWISWRTISTDTSLRYRHGAINTQSRQLWRHPCYRMIHLESNWRDLPLLHLYSLPGSLILFSESSTVQIYTIMSIPPVAKCSLSGHQARETGLAWCP